MPLLLDLPTRQPLGARRNARGLHFGALQILLIPLFVLFLSIPPGFANDLESESESDPNKEAVAATVPASIPLALVERTIDQDRVAQTSTRDHQNCWLYWRIDYRLRNDGETPLEVLPAEVTATVDGWLSNSRVPCHAVPRLTSHTLSGSTDLATSTAVVTSNDLTEDCKESAVLHLWPEGQPAPVNQGTEGSPAPGPPFTLAPGESLRARLILEHRHFLHGPFEPLLGHRSLELRIGPATFRDELPLNQPLYVAQAPTTWDPLPVDRLDPRQFVSPPDSLYLAADIAGRSTLELPERPVRYGTPMRLSFWYLVAPGTQGTCRVEIKQFREAPKSYKLLSDGRHESRLTEVGRWTHFEKIYRTEPEANLLKLRFAIEGTHVGEMWIDDVTLEPIASRDDRP